MKTHTLSVMLFENQFIVSETKLIISKWEVITISSTFSKTIKLKAHSSNSGRHFSEE